MPQLPKWMVDTMEKVLSSRFFEAEVISVFALNAKMLNITFKTDLSTMEIYPGWAVMLRIDDTSLRHYTISYFDRENNWFEILFHLHGFGPGSNLANAIKIGDKIKMAVPSGWKMYNPESKYHFFFGDETSLGFILMLKDEIKKNNGNLQGVIETRPQNIKVPNQLGLYVEIVERTPEKPGSQSIEYVSNGLKLQQFL